MYNLETDYGTIKLTRIAFGSIIASALTDADLEERVILCTKQGIYIPYVNNKASQFFELTENDSKRILTVHIMTRFGSSKKYCIDTFREALREKLSNITDDEIVTEVVVDHKGVFKKNGTKIETFRQKKEQ